MKAEITLALMRSLPYERIISEGLTASEVLHLSAASLAELGRYESADQAEQALISARAQAADEIEFAEKNNIRLLTPLSEEYPRRLTGDPSGPRLLSVLGEACLDPAQALAIVGTRKPTPYGADSATEIVKKLSTLASPTTIVSGLAYGIDSAAHRAALDAGLPTIAVVGHGLSMIYPAGNRQLAARIVKEGGAIVTEYTHNSAPFRGHFLARNAIIARLSDATLVVESAIKGGAMGTAAHAHNFDRTVFALPGRTCDPLSQGCNHLISHDRALLTSSAKDIIEAMGWSLTGSPKTIKQPSLFPEAETNVHPLLKILRSSRTPLTLDELTRLSGMRVHEVMAEISELEFEGEITRWPGSRFSIK